VKNEAHLDQVGQGANLANTNLKKRWFADAFQRDEERRVLSLRNLTSFRDILAVPSNG
jgi:hypothetical protein